MGKNLSGFQDKWKMVFCFQIFLAYCEKKIDRLIEKNFWNSRLNAEYLQTFWDHKNNLFKQWKASTITVKSRLVQLRDSKNDFIFNFNFDDKMKNLWTVWISHKIWVLWTRLDQHCPTPEKMSWANTHLNLCKLLETELRLAQRLAQHL